MWLVVKRLVVVVPVGDDRLQKRLLISDRINPVPQVLIFHHGKKFIWMPALGDQVHSGALFEIRHQLTQDFLESFFTHFFQFLLGAWEVQVVIDTDDHVNAKGVVGEVAGDCAADRLFRL